MTPQSNPDLQPDQLTYLQNRFPKEWVTLADAEDFRKVKRTAYHPLHAHWKKVVCEGFFELVPQFCDATMGLSEKKPEILPILSRSKDAETAVCTLLQEMAVSNKLKDMVSLFDTAAKSNLFSAPVEELLDKIMSQAMLGIQSIDGLKDFVQTEEIPLQLESAWIASTLGATQSEATPKIKELLGRRVEATFLDVVQADWVCQQVTTNHLKGLKDTDLKRIGRIGQIIKGCYQTTDNISIKLSILAHDKSWGPIARIVMASQDNQTTVQHYDWTIDLGTTGAPDHLNMQIREELFNIQSTFLHKAVNFDEKPTRLRRLHDIIVENPNGDFNTILKYLEGKTEKKTEKTQKGRALTLDSHTRPLLLHMAVYAH